MQFPPPNSMAEESRALLYRNEQELESLIYPDDEQAMVRIGRILSPYQVTTSVDGNVKLWSLLTSDMLAEAQIENGPAVFGQINNSASHFAWRDPYSEGLNLLSFENEQSEFIAPLNNQYVQWFFVSDPADVVLGVHIGDNPVVMAWIVESGELIELGEYRECSRVPDMARLSEDGTTLVIGCDTGLDIWRIQEG